jgi:hypothetical protein
VLLGVAAALFLAGFGLIVYVVVHRPDYVVLTGMDEAELRWFRPRMERFAEDHHVKLAVLAWSDADGLARLLAADRRREHPRVLLAEVPSERLAALAESSAFLPLATVLGESELQDLARRFHPPALADGRVASKALALPARLTTLCLYYSKAHVADAYAHWTTVRPQVDAWLKEVNGYGLPEDFRIEPDPAQWDTYDLFVAAAYWAATPEAGMKVPRVAHVVAPPHALVFDVASRAYAMGSQGDELLLVGGDRLSDALAWEALYFRHGLYHPGMTREHWTARDVEAAIAQGQVWMDMLDPRDVFRLRGLPGQDAFVKDASDIGVAPMPRGESLLLERKDPARAGDPWAARGGTGWAAPATCPDRALAGKLLAALADEGTVADAATTLGWLPPFADTPQQIGTLYKDATSTDIGRVASRQAFEFGRALPASPHWPASEAALAAVWEQACVRDQLTAPIALEEALRQAAPAR